jgi:hypothetical protein
MCDQCIQYAKSCGIHISDTNALRRSQRETRISVGTCASLYGSVEIRIIIYAEHQLGSSILAAIVISLFAKIIWTDTHKVLCVH